MNASFGLADRSEEVPAGRARRTMLLRASLIAVGTYAALTIVLALNQDAMTYFPTKLAPDEASALAAASGLERWENAAGETIGYRAEAPRDDPRPRASVLVLHGNAGCALDRAGYVPLLRGAAPGHALSVYILEYPGYGAREGRPSQEAILASAKAAIDLVPSGQPLVALGESLGSGPACYLAGRGESRPTAVLLVTPFDSFASVAQYHYPILPVRWLMRDKYPSLEWVRGARCPASFIMAGRDKVVPTRLGEKLYAAYAGPKKMWTAPDAVHNDVTECLPETDWRAAMEFALP